MVKIAIVTGTTRPGTKAPAVADWILAQSSSQRVIQKPNLPERQQLVKQVRLSLQDQLLGSYVRMSLAIVLEGIAQQRLLDVLSTLSRDLQHRI